MNYSPWGHKELDMTEPLSVHTLSIWRHGVLVVAHGIASLLHRAASLVVASGILVAAHITFNYVL